MLKRVLSSCLKLLLLLLLLIAGVVRSAKTDSRRHFTTSQ